MRSLKWKVRLDGERRNADPRKVAPSFVHDEPRFPRRGELPVEVEQVVELESSFEPPQRRGLDLLRARELAVGREQRREWSEVERDALDSP